MRKPWRTTALVLFTAAALGGGLVGDKLLAVSGDERDNLRLYTEMLQAAHQSYGADVAYRDLVYASIQGMLRTLDPHTSFLSPEAYENMRERQASSFFGLGILVSMRNGQLTVISPLEGTPAYRLGLRAGDVINAIEGEPTDTMTLDEAVDRLKGPKDTEVGITILRRGMNEPLALRITRAEIPQTTVRFAYMLEPGTGYIRLTDFSRSTASEMDEALDRLRAEGMERLILDLRNNGGGLLDQTVAVANRFVPAGTRIVETRGRTRDSRQSFDAEDTAEPIGVPLVVLVNNGTASAAEILAGAVQDHDVGLVLGTPTWGKGLVQTVYNLPFGAGIALTTAKYYTPSGRLIQRDYSSYFDYYTHFDNRAAGDAAAAGDGADSQIDGGQELPAPAALVDPEFTTDLGRAVYGGGGITPDTLLDLPDLPAEMQYLYAKNAFFDFAVDFANQNEIPSTAWQPPADLLDRFHAWLLAEEVADAGKLEKVFADDDARELAARQIHSDIFNSKFGTEEANKVLAAGDIQIKKALELFERASTMLVERGALEDGGLPPRSPQRSAEAVGGINDVPR